MRAFAAFALALIALVSFFAAIYIGDFHPAMHHAMQGLFAAFGLSLSGSLVLCILSSSSY